VGVHSFTHSYILESMKCDSRASFLVRTFVGPCLNSEPKAKVATWIDRKDVVSQPHFEGNVRLPLTLLKMGLGSPLGPPKTQSVIARVKTPCIEVFLIPLERSSNVDVQMALHEPFGHL
jgi:hypothetical protein